MITLLNPAPMSDDVLQGYDMNMVDLCIVNETEAKHLLCLLNTTHSPDLASSSPVNLADQLLDQFPNLAGVIVTLGADGLLAKFAVAGQKEPESIRLSAFPVHDKVVDTTGAGDTFIGYLATGLIENGWQPETPMARSSIEMVLRQASMASALAIQTQGATESIPLRDQVDQALALL
jgi:ribokinase